MYPGGAISIFSIILIKLRFFEISSAINKGFFLSILANFIATFV